MKTKSLNYYVLDVFTNQRFGGNPLAIVLDADDLSTDQMQLITREFNFSETSFVLKPKNASNTANVRIFTPTFEMPFAGHPNVGTGFMLAHISDQPMETMVFEEIAGLVSIKNTYDQQQITQTTIRAPLSLSMGETLDPKALAMASGLSEDDIATNHHLPIIASVGAEFAIVELKTEQALKNLQVNEPKILKALPEEGPFAIYFYTRDTASSATKSAIDWNARMMSFRGEPLEDPATGSASGACAALQHHLGIKPINDQSYNITQGIEMGRPSRLNLNMIKAEQGADIVEISGQCVLVMRGQLFL